MEFNNFTLVARWIMQNNLDQVRLNQTSGNSEILKKQSLKMLVLGWKDICLTLYELNLIPHELISKMANQDGQSDES